MAENKEIIEKLVELVEIYLENAQMNEVSTEWQEGDIDFEEVLSIVVHDGLYDLNFTEEQTNEFLALYKALNQEQVEISEAKLDKKDKKGDNIMEKEVKEDKKLPIESLVSDLIQQLMDFGADEESIIWTLKQYGFTEEEIKQEFGLPLDAEMGESKKPVTEVKKPIKERESKLLEEFMVVMLHNGWEEYEYFEDRKDAIKFAKDFFKENPEYFIGVKGPKGGEVFSVGDLDANMTKKESKNESDKPLKESIRLIYNPKEKTEVKEKVELSFDGEPLPVDIKESNTHTKLRLFKVK
jgi:hypothetical protein